ncbi:MAG: ribonuclease P protein component [Zoogloeaceae bacterium]|jgi:ribonuclease P protein component|nr:ribonuclease P protein component [Zoogloeaceae bacterium]
MGKSSVPSHPLDLSGAYPFPRQYRLIQTDAYASVFAFRRALRGAHFLLHYGECRPPDSGASARLGLVMGKKFMRRATGRNCLKRLARETFRQARAQLPARDLVLRLFVKMQKPDRPMRRALALEIRQLLARIETRANAAQEGGKPV